MLQQALDEYIAFLSSREEEGKGSNLNTIIAYRHDLKQLCQYLVSKGVKDWSQVTHEIMALFLLEMQESQLYRPATIVRKVASFKSFFRYLYKNGMIALDPIGNLAPPPVHKDLPHVLEAKQIDNLLAQVPSSTLVGIRDLAMLHMLYATGMRASEVVSLDLEDFDVAKAAIHCVGRNRRIQRERWLPLSPEVTEHMQRYVHEARPRLVRRDDEPALFVNHHGERLTRQGFWLIIKGYARQAGITNITPHVIRHSFAALMLKNGMELRSVQELLGHAHLSTMYIYSQIVQAEAVDDKGRG
jgi:integrase/recombinase XerD